MRWYPLTFGIATLYVGTKRALGELWHVDERTSRPIFPDEPEERRLRPPFRFLVPRRCLSPRESLDESCWELAGLVVGIFWVMVESLSGARLMGLWMIGVAWLISRADAAVARQGDLAIGLVSWRLGLPAVGVTLVVCLLLNIFYDWRLYCVQADCPDFSPVEVLALFPASWHFSSLLVYALAAGVAYYNSYDRTFAKSHAGNFRQPSRRWWQLPPLVQVGLVGVGMLGFFVLLILLMNRTSIQELAMSPDQRSLAVLEGGPGGRLILHDLASGHSVVVRSARADRVAWSPDGEWLACAKNYSDSKETPSYAELRLMNRLGNSAFPLLTHTRLTLHCLAFSPDGHTLVAAGNDILLCDPDRRWVMDRFESEHSVYSLAFSANGTLAAGLSDGQIVLWDMDTRKPLRSWQAHRTTICRLAFHPQREVLFSTATGEKRACAWDAASGKELKRYPLDTDWTTGLALAPDGRTLAVFGGSFHRPGEVRLFDSDSGEVRRVFQAASNTVTSAAFSADGQTLLAGTRPPLNPLTRPGNGKLHRWDLSTGEELPPLQ